MGNKSCICESNSPASIEPRYPSLRNSRVGFNLLNEEQQQQQYQQYMNQQRIAQLRCKNIARINQKYSPGNCIDEEGDFSSVVSVAFSHTHNHISSSISSLFLNNNNNNTSSIKLDSNTHSYSNNNNSSNNNNNNNNNNNSSVISESKRSALEHYSQEMHLPSKKQRKNKSRKPVDVLLQSRMITSPEGNNLTMTDEFVFKHLKTDKILRFSPRVAGESTQETWKIVQTKGISNCNSSQCKSKEIAPTAFSKEDQSSQQVVPSKEEDQAHVDVKENSQIIGEVESFYLRNCMKNAEMAVEKRAMKDGGILEVVCNSTPNSNVESPQKLWKMIAHNRDGVLRDNSIVTIVHTHTNRILVPSTAVSDNVHLAQKKFKNELKEIPDLWVIQVIPRNITES